MYCDCFPPLFLCVLREITSTFLLQPGLTGGSDDSYVRHMLVRARNSGWRVVVFNSRGCADSPVTTPQVNVESNG